MTGLWGSKTNNLMPEGMGTGASSEQMAMFGQAAQDSGLMDFGKQALMQATGMSNENQIQTFYELMATHPNEVSLFFLHYPDFLRNLLDAFRLVVRQEIYEAFNSGMLLNAENRPMMVDANVAASNGYSTITTENFDAAIAKTLPLEKMQMEVHQADMAAMQKIQQSQMGFMDQMYQQQMQGMNAQQQQWAMQQQQGMPQRPGMGGMLGAFGASMLRGTLGLPPAQPYGMYPQQGAYGQQPSMGNPPTQ